MADLDPRHPGQADRPRDLVLRLLVLAEDLRLDLVRHPLGPALPLPDPVR